LAGNTELSSCWTFRAEAGGDTHETAAGALLEEAEYDAETEDAEASQAAAAEQQKQQKPRTGQKSWMKKGEGYI